MYSLINGLHFDLLTNIYKPKGTQIFNDSDKRPDIENKCQIDLPSCIERTKENTVPLQGPFDCYVNYVDAISTRDVIFEKVRLSDVCSTTEESNLPQYFIRDFMKNDCLSVNEIFQNADGLTREEQFLFTNLGQQKRHDIVNSFFEAANQCIEKSLKNLRDGDCQQTDENNLVVRHTNRYLMHLENIRSRMRESAVSKIEQSSKKFASNFYPHRINPKLFQEFLYLKRAITSEAIFHQTVNTHIGNVILVNENLFTGPEQMNRLLFMCKKQVDVKNSLCLQASELSIRLLLPPLLSITEGLYEHSKIRTSCSLHILSRVLKLSVDDLVQIKSILDMQDFKGLNSSISILKKIIEQQWHMPGTNDNLSNWRHVMCLAIIISIYNLSVDDESVLNLSRCDNPNRLMVFSKTNTMVYNLENMTIYLSFGTVYLIPKHNRCVYKGTCIFSIIEKLFSE